MPVSPIGKRNSEHYSLVDYGSHVAIEDQAGRSFALPTWELVAELRDLLSTAMPKNWPKCDEQK